MLLQKQPLLPGIRFLPRPVRQYCPRPTRFLKQRFRCSGKMFTMQNAKKRRPGGLLFFTLNKGSCKSLSLVILNRVKDLFSVLQKQILRSAQDDSIRKTDFCK